VALLPLHTETWNILQGLETFHRAEDLLLTDDHHLQEVVLHPLEVALLLPVVLQEEDLHRLVVLLGGDLPHHVALL